jgi:hypothetical protein
VRYLPLLYVIGSRQQNDPITFSIVSMTLDWNA